MIGATKKIWSIQDIKNMLCSIQLTMHKTATEFESSDPHSDYIRGFDDALGSIANAFGADLSQYQGTTLIADRKEDKSS